MRQCAICGKSYIRGRSRKKLRGKYNPTPWRQKKANLQKTKLATGSRILACTQCLKTLTRLDSARQTRSRAL